MRDYLQFALYFGGILTPKTPRFAL